MYPEFYTQYDGNEVDITYKIQFSEKLYYKKFSYKIFLKFPGLFTSRKENEHLNQLLKKYNEEEYSKRHGIPHRTDIVYATIDCLRLQVYTNNQELVKEILDEFEEYIILLGKPLNNKHNDVLKTQDKNIIRKQLFFKKYRYMVSFDRYAMFRSGDGIQKTREDIKEYFVSNKRIDEVDYRFKENREPVLYIRDANDLMMIKLIFAEYISRTETIILHTEIK
jgi:hypothetical protein